MIGIIIKVIANLGKLSQDLSDFEQDAKDLFAGKLTEDEIKTFLADVGNILATGIIALPEGIAAAAIIETLNSGEAVVADVMAAIKGVEEKGASEVAPDLKKIAMDLKAALNGGLIKLSATTSEQVNDVLDEIIKGIA